MWGGYSVCSGSGRKPRLQRGLAVAAGLDNIANLACKGRPCAWGAATALHSTLAIQRKRSGSPVGGGRQWLPRHLPRKEVDHSLSWRHKGAAAAPRRLPLDLNARGGRCVEAVGFGFAHLCAPHQRLALQILNVTYAPAGNRPQPLSRVGKPPPSPNSRALAPPAAGPCPPAARAAAAGAPSRPAAP